MTKCKSPRTYRNPLFLVLEWNKMLESGDYASETELARYLGISRARVNQMLRLLKLPQKTQESVIRMGDPLPSRKINKRRLRTLLSSTQVE